MMKSEFSINENNKNKKSNQYGLFDNWDMKFPKKVTRKTSISGKLRRGLSKTKEVEDLCLDFENYIETLSNFCLQDSFLNEEVGYTLFRKRKNDEISTSGYGKSGEYWVNVLTFIPSITEDGCKHLRVVDIRDLSPFNVWSESGEGHRPIIYQTENEFKELISRVDYGFVGEFDPIKNYFNLPDGKSIKIHQIDSSTYELNFGGDTSYKITREQIKKIYSSIVD